MPIYFHNDDVAYQLKGKLLLKRWLKGVVVSEGKELGLVNYIFCSDVRLLDINNQFLKHNYYTDIITFDNTDGALIAGEMYISVDRVIDNSLKFNVKEYYELCRVMVHGLLHLLGYKDKSKKEIETMRAKEDYYLKQLIM